MADRNLQILITAKDLTGDALKSISGRLNSAEDASKKFGIGLAAVTGTAVLFGKKMLEAAGDFEQSQIAFTTMLGSADKANQLLQELTAFAKRTPFELKGLEEQAKKLLAYGIAEDKIIETTKMLGDISAGVGMDKLPNLTLAFGQVKAATRLTGMELRQFTEAGVPLLDELSRVMDKSVQEVQSMVSEGAVGFPIVEQALQNLTGEGGRFEDMMSKQSKSLGGMVSNLQDAWNIFLRNEGQKLLEWGKELVSWAIYMVENVLPRLITTIDQVTQFFGQHKEAIAIIAGAIVGALIPAVYAMITSFIAAGIALAPFMITGAIVGGLIYGIVSIAKNWEQTKDSIKFVWEVIQEIWKKGTDAVKEQIDKLIGWFGEVKQSIMDVLNAFNQLSAKGIVDAWKNAGSNIKWAFDGERAAGGPVRSGANYLVGENGPEIFTPFNNGTIIPNGRIGGVIVNISGNTISNQLDLNNIADIVAGRLMDVLRLNTKLAL